MINFAHSENIDLFIKDNIASINNKISDFKESKLEGRSTFDDIAIKKYLSTKLYNELEENKNAIMDKFTKYKFVKAKIKDIANEFIYYKPNLEKVIEKLVFIELQTLYDPVLCDNIIKVIFKDSNISANKQKFINKALTNIVSKSTYLMLQNGFQNNINNIESGIMTANAGDSAQFLFISRAILAGYNCSNVDVRSSRYDAIIDFKDKLFKVQVKGISGATISFKDRDRGGKGIDTQNERNKGQRITSKDCDIYVAVDKQIGTCYIIPMQDIDSWPETDIQTVSVNDLSKYKENWSIINNLFESKI